MALDIIARAAAASARSDAANALASAASLDLFTNLSAKAFGASVTALTTGGHSVAGLGSGLYVADTAANLALATAHPRFCKADAAGRYFRLVGDYITVEQAGARGQAGINDQPAVQAAIDYAAAVGIRVIQFTQRTYEIWAPDWRSLSWPAFNGSFLNILSGNELELCGASGGTTLVTKGRLGGNILTETQTTANGVVVRGSLMQIGMSGGTLINRVTLRNLIFDGTIDHTNGSGNANSDVTHKGLLVGSDKLVELYVYDCTMKRFRGEVFFVGGNTYPNTVFVQNLTLRDSPQSLWNVATMCRLVAINLDCENSYQPAEVVCGVSHTYIGGRFAKGEAGSAFLSTHGYQIGYPYWWPFRNPAKPLPWTTFLGTRFEKGGATSLASWTRGNIVTVDTTIYAAVFAGRDIHLDIEAWCDQGSGSAAVELSGPASLTTQVAGAPAGTYYPKLANVAVRLRCYRTADAQANARVIDGIKFGPGLMDRNSCIFEVEGAVRYAWFVNGTPVSGFELPLVKIGQIDNLGQAFGAGIYPLTLTPGTTTAVDVLNPTYTLDPNATGTAQITINTTYAYKHGQRVIFTHVNNSAGRLVQFQTGTGGLALKQTRTLYAQGDLIELEYSAFSNKWHEVRYMTSKSGAQFVAPIVLADAATVTPDFGKGTDFEWTIAGNRTLANPANALPGQSGTIRITQDATGGRTMASGSNWRWPGGKAAGGVLSTAAGAVDVLRYTVGSDGLILATLNKAMAV